MKGAILAFLAACVLALVAYKPVLQTGTMFLYEDAVTIQNNPMVRGMQPISLSTPRWLTYTTYRIDAWRSGHVEDFHLTSMALHLTVCALLFGWLLRWHSPFAAFVGATVMLFNPINSESLSYLTARSELILGIGVMLALWCVPRPDQRWTFWRGAGVILATYIAIGGKEMGIVTPLLVMLLAPVPRWTWPILGLMGSVALWRLFDQHTAIGTGVYPAGQSFLLQCAALAHGLRLIVWPIGLTVDADVAATALTWQLLAVSLIAAVILIALVAAIAVMDAPLLNANWRNDWTILVAWICISVGPRLFAHSWEWINEHQFYVAMIGISIIAARVAQRMEWNEMDSRAYAS